MADGAMRAIASIALLRISACRAGIATLSIAIAFVIACSIFTDRRSLSSEESICSNRSRSAASIVPSR